MNKVKLPKGVTVYIGGQKYGGDRDIPADICPEKFKPKKTVTKQETVKAK